MNMQKSMMSGITRNIAICLAFTVTTIPALGGEELPKDLEDWDKPIGGEFARALSDGTYPAIGATVGAYMLGDSYDRETGRRMIDALFVAGMGTQLLKELTKQNRPIPHHVNDRGFPSGHAAIAFATATVVGDRDPDLEIPALALAGIVSWSRHQTRQHFWDQIIAGAVLGYWAGSQAADGKFHLLADKDGTAPQGLQFRAFDREADTISPWVLYRTDF